MYNDFKYHTAKKIHWTKISPDPSTLALIIFRGKNFHPYNNDYHRLHVATHQHWDKKNHSTKILDMRTGGEIGEIFSRRILHFLAIQYKTCTYTVSLTCTHILMRTPCNYKKNQVA